MTTLLHTNAARTLAHYEQALWGVEGEPEATAEPAAPSGAGQHDPLNPLDLPPATAALEASEKQKERDETSKIRNEEKTERQQERKENRETPPPVTVEINNPLPIAAAAPVPHTSSRTSTGTGRQ